jgi:hypothetical protein
MSHNWVIAVVLAALSFFALGGIWYTVLLGRQWRAEMGITEEQAQNTSPMVMQFVWSIVVSLVIAFTLSKLIGEAGTSYGLKVGAGTGAGIGAAILAQNYVYESRTPRFFAINGAYVVIGLGIMGTIVGAIQG